MRILLSVLLQKCAGLRSSVTPREACEGMHRSDRYTNCVKAAAPLPFQGYVVDLCLLSRQITVTSELPGELPSQMHEPHFLDGAPSVGFWHVKSA